MGRSRLLIIFLLISLAFNIILGSLGGAHIYRRITGWFRTIDKPAEGAPLAFFCRYEQMEPLMAIQGDGQEVPKDSLYLKPGKYRINGQTYDLQQEGLYRFIVPFGKNRQVIVYQNDVMALLSSWSWMVSHGSRDNALEYKEKLRKLTKRKLTLTCGAVSNLVKKQLDAKNIPSREIHMVTLDKPNGFDDSHVMLEVKMPSSQKWVVFDLDNNHYFSADSTLLNYWDWYKRARDGQYSIQKLSTDTRLDIGGFNQKGYDFGLYMEQINTREEALRKWYAHVAGLPVIDNLYMNTYPLEIGKKYKPEAKSVDSLTFIKTLYP